MTTACTHCGRLSDSTLCFDCCREAAQLRADADQDERRSAEEDGSYSEYLYQRADFRRRLANDIDGGV